MVERTFKIINICTALLLINSTVAGAQSKVDALWQLYQKAKPLQVDLDFYKSKGSPQTSKICLSGDCDNGYGIAIYFDNGLTRYQYEGNFINGQQNGMGAISISTGLYEVGNFKNNQKVGGYLQVNDGLVWLRNADGKGFVHSEDEFGFALTDVKKHLVYSFEKSSKCNCLKSAIYYEDVTYTEDRTPLDRFGNELPSYTVTKHGDKERLGSKNICDKPIYVKAISKDDFSQNGMVYHDKSITILPGYTYPIEIQFTSNYNSNEIGTQFLGQYTKNELAKNENVAVKKTVYNDNNASKINNNSTDNFSNNVNVKPKESIVSSDEKAVNDEINNIAKYYREPELKDRIKNDDRITIPYSKKSFSDIRTYFKDFYHTSGSSWKGEFIDKTLGVLECDLFVDLDKNDSISGVLTMHKNDKDYLLFRYKGKIYNNEITFILNELANTNFVNSINPLKFMGRYAYNKDYKVIMEGIWETTEGENLYFMGKKKYTTNLKLDDGTFKLTKEEH